MTGACIIIPNENDEDNETITIIGKKEDAEKAKAELEAIIEQIVSTGCFSTMSSELEC